MFRTKRTSQVAAAMSSVAIWLAIGTFSYQHLEKWTWIEALYFSTVTLTTVGYGDLHPTNDVSRLFTVFYILAAVVTAIGAISVISSRRIERHAERRAEREAEKEAERAKKA